MILIFFLVIKFFKLNQLFKYNQAFLFCFSYLSNIVLFSTSYFIVVILEPYPSSTEAFEYFKLNLQPILLKGLTAMAKLKPASDTINAVVSSPIHLHLHIWKTCFQTFLTFFVPNCLKGLDKFLFHHVQFTDLIHTYDMLCSMHLLIWFYKPTTYIYIYNLVLIWFSFWNLDHMLEMACYMATWQQSTFATNMCVSWSQGSIFKETRKTHYGVPILLTYHHSCHYLIVTITKKFKRFLALIFWSLWNTLSQLQGQGSNNVKCCTCS